MITLPFNVQLNILWWLLELGGGKGGGKEGGKEGGGINFLIGSSLCFNITN